MSRFDMIVVGFLCAAAVAYAIFICIRISPPVRSEIEDLVIQLISNDGETSIQAEQKLITLGSQAIPFLEERNNPVNWKIENVLYAINNPGEIRPVKKSFVHPYTEINPIGLIILLLVGIGIIGIIRVLLSMKKNFGRFW